MVSLELDINISPEAGGIKFFRGTIFKAWGKKKKKIVFFKTLCFQIYQQLSSGCEVTATKSLEKLEGCKNGQGVGLKSQVHPQVHWQVYLTPMAPAQLPVPGPDTGRALPDSP